MKKYFALSFMCFLVYCANGQTANTKATTPDVSKPVQTVEVSCGKCKFGLPGKSCDMAVRIDNKAYYVDGANIDNFGDAHAHDGMCNAIRKAEVQGELVKGRYKITYIKLLPEKKAED